MNSRSLISILSLLLLALSVLGKSDPAYLQKAVSNENNIDTAEVDVNNDKVKRYLVSS